MAESIIRERKLLKEKIVPKLVELGFDPLKIIRCAWTLSATGGGSC
jgi:hypothetical protein